MRNIKHIVLHCTATPQNTSVKSIQEHWKTKMGWSNPGYHFLIEPDGKVNNLQSVELIANGVAGYNKEAIHISYIGGVDNNGKAIDNRTAQQKAAQIKLILELSHKFPKAKVLGHRDFPNVHKECPSFDVSLWLKKIGFVNPK